MSQAVGYISREMGRFIDRPLFDPLSQSICKKASVCACLPGRDQHICTVFPRRLVERLLFAGFSAQVHVKHDQPVSQDLVARKHGKGAAAAMPPRVGGVLGAGNLSIIPLLDIVHMLVMENATVVCKMNQVRLGGVKFSWAQVNSIRIVSHHLLPNNESCSSR